MIWLLVALVAVLWLGRRRRTRTVVQPVVVVIHVGDDDDGDTDVFQPTDSDIHHWISQ